LVGASFLARNRNRSSLPSPLLCLPPCLFVKWPEHMKVTNFLHRFFLCNMDCGGFTILYKKTKLLLKTKKRLKITLVLKAPGVSAMICLCSEFLLSMSSCYPMERNLSSEGRFFLVENRYIRTKRLKILGCAKRM